MKKRILVIDDYRAIRNIAKLFADENTAIIVAKTGQEGLEKLDKEFGGKVDIILLDLKMPKMNGVQTYKELRKLTDAKIFIMTGTPDSEELDGLKSMGVTILPKPFDMDYLLKSLL